MIRYVATVEASCGVHASASTNKVLTRVCHFLAPSYAHTHTHAGKLWLPATLVNYAFVKPSLRVLFENVVFFVWTIILSFLLHT